MPKRNYDVGETAPSPNSTSLRKCVGAVLLFLGMCIIIVLVAVLVPSRNSRSTNGEAKTLEGGRFTATSHRSIIVSTLKPREKEKEEAPTTIPEDVEIIDRNDTSGTSNKKEELVVSSVSEESSSVSSTTPITPKSNQPGTTTSTDAPVTIGGESSTSSVTESSSVSSTTPITPKTSQPGTTTSTNAPVTIGGESTTSSVTESSSVSSTTPITPKTSQPGTTTSTDAPVTIEGE